jgi:hypothetical protein
MIIWCMTVNDFFPWTTNCIISSPSFCIRGHCVFSCCCVLACGPSCFDNCCIFSWTSMSLDVISSYCAFAMQTTSSPLPWTLSTIKYVSSSIRFMTRSSIMYFLFLRAFPSLYFLLFVRDVLHLLYLGSSLPQPVKYPNFHYVFVSCPCRCFFPPWSFRHYVSPGWLIPHSILSSIVG